MKYVLKMFIFAAFCSSLAAGQELSSKQKLEKIEELNSRIKILETSLLAPDEKDLKRARSEGFDVFRIMPREVFDRKLNIQGGGSYYSFTTGSHDYQKIAQIGLEQNNLKVGFAGADYGFIKDLGEISLADITKNSVEANFLVNYKPPTDEPEVRIEQRRAWNYEADGSSYRREMPAVVGQSYLLRAISFSQADVLVALKVHRRDENGSLIIFWKLLENFEKPLLARN